MSITSVADVKPFKTMWNIKVKVIRLWRHNSAARGETIEMVLCDVRGGKIQASVKTEFVAKFKPFLRQGISFMLTNFALIDSKGSYRTTNHAYRMTFLSTTRVRPCEPLCDSLSGFEPVTYKEVLGGCLSPDYLIDVIGQIVEVSHMEHVNVNGNETEKIDLQLRNADDERLSVVLWGKTACDVYEAMQIGDKKKFILVLRFAKIKVCKEGTSVTNAYNVSEIGLNLPMIEVAKFIASLPDDNLPMVIVESQYSGILNGVDDEDAVFFNTPRKTIAEILETKQVEKCILTCTVAGIDYDMGWFYPSCKVCSKKVLTVSTKDEGNDEYDLEQTYYCAKCKTYNPLTTPRYKLHLVVLDSTGNTKLVVLDNLAIQLLNQPILNIVGPSDKVEIEDTDIVPPAVSTIIGKTYLLKIQIEKDNIVNNDETYKVVKVITNRHLITDFDESYSPNVSKEGEGRHEITPSNTPAGSAMGGFGFVTILPAKRIWAANIEFGESYFDNSETSCGNAVKMKKEQFEESG